LIFADRVFSGGLFPNSLTALRKQHGNSKKQELLLYALNAGGPEIAVCQLTPDAANTPNMTGFKVTQAGRMIPLDSTQPIDPVPLQPRAA